MKELLIVPIIALLLLGIGSQLTETAQQTGDKAVVYAQDMSNAMDCAILGKPLSDCSPNLIETDFKGDLEAYETQLEEIQAELEAVELELEKKKAKKSAN